MTDEAWIRGMGQLVACFPAQDESPERKAIRGKTYREALNRLSDDTWLYAVKAAVEHERWFPTIACLLDYATDAPEVNLRALPEDTRTIEQKREDFKRGFDTLKRLYWEHMLDLDKLAEAKTMPEAK